MKTKPSILIGAVGLLLGAVALTALLTGLIAAIVRVIERPDHATSVCIGVWLGLAGALAILIGAWQALRDERTEEAEARIENLMELVSAAGEYESRDAEASLGGFVDRLSLLSEVDEVEGSKEARVWLMSMHAAKGLEWRAVFVVGLVDGTLPIVYAALLVFYDARPDIAQRIFPKLWQQK